MNDLETSNNIDALETLLQGIKQLNNELAFSMDAYLEIKDRIEQKISNLKQNELIKKSYYPLVFQFENRVSIYIPVDCKTLEKGDIIADWQRPFPLGDERLIYKGQQNEHEDYISLLCFTESTNYKTDKNGRVWASFEKNKRAPMYIFRFAELALAYKLHEFQEFETKKLACDFWENMHQRIKQKLYTY